jgi:type IV pilus assembly protein PilN
VLQQMTSAQESRNSFLNAEIARLDTQIKDIATLRTEIEALKARQKAVEDLQTDRNVPVHLLDELVRQTPEGVYLTSIRQNGQVVAINGVAQTNERVSELLRNTLYNSAWLTKPELVEITAISADHGQQGAAPPVPVLDARVAQAPGSARTCRIPASGAALAAPAKSS